MQELPRSGEDRHTTRHAPQHVVVALSARRSALFALRGRAGGIGQRSVAPNGSAHDTATATAAAASRRIVPFPALVAVDAANELNRQCGGGARSEQRRIK